MKNIHVIPTAEEFFRKFKHTHSPVNHHLALIEFAKLHVEQALKKASKQTPININLDTGRYNKVLYQPLTLQKGILDSYPLTLIK